MPHAPAISETNVQGILLADEYNYCIGKNEQTGLDNERTDTALCSGISGLLHRE